MKVYMSMLLLLGTVFAIAAAGPISQTNVKDMISKALNQELTSEVEYATYGKCLTRVHTIKIDFGGYEYIYKYRACRKGAYRCYDARENVPEPCPEGFYGENCYDIEWKVQGKKYEHSICEDFGPPCQAPITYYIGRTQYKLQKSNYRGVCYLPNPIYNGGQTVGPYNGPHSQKQEWSAKAANSISLCEEENGSDEGCKQVPNDIKVVEQEDDEDCFCIKRRNGGTPVCNGKCIN